MAPPVDGIGLRVLVAMLAHVDGPHWTQRGELVSLARLDRLAADALVSKPSVAKARRNLEAMGMVERLERGG